MYTQRENKALDHLRSCMEKFSFGSQEYNLAQKAFSWIANEIRRRQKLNIESYLPD